MYSKVVIKCIPSIMLRFEEHLHKHFFFNGRYVQMTCMSIKTILLGNHKCELLAKSYIRKKRTLDTDATLTCLHKWEDDF